MEGTHAQGYDHLPDDSMRREMVDAANDHKAAIAGMTEDAAFTYAKAVIDGNDIVFGVWQDPDNPDGVGMLVIKG